VINCIAIDPSLTNTAVCINGKLLSFPMEKIAKTKNGEWTKWFELSAPHVKYWCHTFEHTNKEYSDTECLKLRDYGGLAWHIAERVSTYLQYDPRPGFHTENWVAIEGYSYSSAAGPLIDLVTFGTLLRHRLREHEFIHPEMEIVSPTQLKAKAAALTYPWVKESKKVIHRNKQGLAGGSFKKPEMYKAIIENDNFDDDWAKFLRTYAEDVLNYKSIPKPIEDLNDAYLLYKSMLGRVPELHKCMLESTES
jgi:hypothetical protein